MPLLLSAALGAQRGQRFTETVRGGHDIEQQRGFARICYFGQVKSERAVIHRLRRIFKNRAQRMLVYTASAGNQGTLGGLVEVTQRFGRILKSALERARLCSGDPVCADHDPFHVQDDRMLHGAAYHGRLLISETSCEARNVSLDRALLVDTVGTPDAGHF
jgi:hypothetical protein